MADDGLTNEQLRAALHEARAEIAALRADAEMRERTLAESLEQQTATAEVLRVIAESPAVLQEVLQVIVDAAIRLCAADAGLIQRRHDDLLIAEVASGGRSIEALAEVRRSGYPGMRLVPTSIAGRTFLERRSIHITDVAAAVDSDYPESKPGFILNQHRTQLSVPLLRLGEAIGVVTLHRYQQKPFSDREIALLETFADQAVIAIENVRLFTELGERNAELTASLEQQTTTADILQIIAGSPTDLQPVFDVIVASAERLSNSAWVHLNVVEGDKVKIVAGVQSRTPWRRQRVGETQDLASHVPGLIALRAGQTMHIPDRSAPSFTREFPDAPSGPNATLHVPLLLEGRGIGVISLGRELAEPYRPEEIALIETFANQAVIAIQNVRLFRELQEANQQLAEASQHKSQFLANMSHELRTPLNAIIGYSEMLQEEAEDLDADAFIPDLQKVNAAGKHLLGLINDILDLSKIEAGRMDLYLEDFSVGQLVQDVAAIVQPLIEKNGNGLVVVCPDDVGTMRADLTKVRQTLFNLLSNAAKFTDRGQIELRVWSRRDESRRDDSESDGAVLASSAPCLSAPGSSALVFAVADTGIGMTEEQLGRLFEAFSQAEASTKSRYGGTGLGLAISRHFCRLMGGDLTVQSVYGQGSTFTISLPRQVATPATA